MNKIILVAYKIRIYPNKIQREQLNKTFGCCRFLYNKMLEEISKVGKRKTEKEYKEEFEFLKEVDSTALQQSRIDLQMAFNNFKASKDGKRKGRIIGYPQFKSKRNDQSFRVVLTNGNIKIDNHNKTIKIPKTTPIKFRDKRIVEGDIRNITISKNCLGQYFASILVEKVIDIEVHKVSSSSKVIGLDYDSKNLFTDNQGNIGDYPRFYRMYEEKLVRVQRKLSKAKRRSKNRNKLRLKVAKIHRKIQNSRNDFHNKLTTYLVKNYDVIGIEDLNMTTISRSLNLAKSTLDNAWGYFRNKLEYKCEWYGRHLIFADKLYASTKTCSNCGYKNVELTLKDREWNCPKCGVYHHRDKNAATNLANYALENCTVGVTGINALSSI